MTDTQYRSFTPDLEVRSGGDGRTVRGIAVPFDVEQRIDSGLTEVFARGAFDHQIGEAHRVKFYRNHAAHGGVLIGRTTEARNDAAGLYGEWRVSKTPTGDETLELIRDDALDELSIGFREVRGGNHRRSNGTIERRKALLTEVAVVPMGAYGKAATITGVRAASCPTCGHSSATGSDQERASDDVRAAAMHALADAQTGGFGMVEEALRASRLPLTIHGKNLWDWLKGPEGTAVYLGKPHPWTALRNFLLAHGVPATQADGEATNIMMATPAGRAAFKAHHGAH